MGHRGVSGKKRVSTHSHPKVAGGLTPQKLHQILVSTHSHPKVAGYLAAELPAYTVVSTHSHPKVAGHCQPTAAHH